MSLRSDKPILSKKMLANFFGLTMMFVSLSLVYVIVNRSDNKILEQRSKYRMVSMPSPVQSHGFNTDEQRIAKLFVTDTLPGLLQRGLIKKYQRSESGTFLLVAGKLWNKRSMFFKQSLLTELFVHNRVNGYAPSSKIMDFRTGKLYASISASAKREFYN